MKIKKIFYELINNARYSLKRFPLTVLISSILVVVLIILNEDTSNSINLRRLAMLIALAIPISVIIKLIDEAYINNSLKKAISYIGGVGFLVLYCFVFLENLNYVAYARYVGTFLILILICSFIQKIRKKDNYEKYIISILDSAFITAIYSFVLYAGSAMIIFTIEQLFELNIRFSIYYYLFLTVVFVFGIAMFLSKYPEADFKDFEYPKAFKVLLLYIVIPLITIYSLILYVYFLKIIITWEWPKGLVSHLVIWYSSVSVFVIFFILPLLKENKVAYHFRRLFPIFSLPILVMMYISIGQRIAQYGFTENRYYVVLLGIWISLIMLHFIVKRPKSSTFIMISLSIFILISLFGPLSSFNVSIRSQNNRLNDILERNNMLNNGVLVANESLLASDQRQINNILMYFNDKHSLSDVEILPAGFELNNMKEYFGFGYEFIPSIDFEPFYYVNQFDHAIETEGYNYYIDYSNMTNKTVRVSDLTVAYNIDEQLVSISKDDNGFTIDIQEEVENIHNKLVNREAYNSEELTVEIDDIYKIRIIFRYIDGQVNANDDLDLYRVEFILLLDYNN